VLIVIVQVYSYSQVPQVNCVVLHLGVTVSHLSVQVYTGNIPFFGPRPASGVVGAALGFDVCFDGPGGWTARDAAWAQAFARSPQHDPMDRRDFWRDLWREEDEGDGGGGDAAACEEWCAEPCAELNGDVETECGACSSGWRCWPGAHDFAKVGAKEEL